MALRKILRILFLLSPLIIVGLAFYEHSRWQPPLNPDMTQPVSIETLLEHNETYKAPMKLIIHGEVYNKSESEEFIFLYGVNDDYFRVNCTNVNVSAVEGGMLLYIRGFSYYHDPEKEYFLAEEIHIQVSYSLYLSIPVLILILIIMFIGFKFQAKDFSFSRRLEEESGNA